MDDSYAETIWVKVNSEALLNIKHNREAAELKKHLIIPTTLRNGISSKMSLIDFINTWPSYTCVGKLFRTQFGFLEDHVRPADFYSYNRDFEKLRHRLRYDKTFANEYFGSWINATGKKHKTFLTRLRNHDVNFLIERIQAKSSLPRLPPDLNVVTLEEYNEIYKPIIITDTSISYSAKKNLISLFDIEDVNVDVLEKWGIDPPVIEVVLPSQYYKRLWFSTWVNGQVETAGGGDNTGTNQYLGLDMISDASLARPTDTTTLITGLEQTLEYKGKVAFELEKLVDPDERRKHNYKTTVQLQEEREDEKINLEEFFRNILNIQLGRAREASSHYRSVKNELSRISTVDINNRRSRQEIYKHMYKITMALHSSETYDTHYSRIERANRKTYEAWCRTFNVDFEWVSSWKAAQDEREQARRESTGIKLSSKGSSQALSDGEVQAVFGLNVLPEKSGAYNLLFTLEKQLTQQVEQVDDIFRQKTGYLHPVEYLTSLDGDADAQFNSTLKSLIDKRLNIAAQLGIVQDRIQDIEGGYQMGSLANKVISGNTFIRQCIRNFIPYAYAELSEMYNEDATISTLETDLRLSQANMIQQQNTLQQLTHRLENFIRSFYFMDYHDWFRDYAADLSERQKATERNARVRLETGLEGTNLFAETEARIAADFTTTISSLFKPKGSLNIAAHYIERANVEGGSPEKFESYTNAVSHLKLVSAQLNNSSKLQEHILPVLEKHINEKFNNHQKNIGSSIARNRKESGFVELFKRFLCSQYQEHSITQNIEKYNQILNKIMTNKKEQNNIHLPLMIEHIVPEPVNMIDLFEDQIAKAAQSIQDNMTKESSLPNVGKLEAELDAERKRLELLRNKRVDEEKIMAERFRRSELARVEQEQISQEQLEHANLERIAAEEKRIVQEQESATRIAAEQEATECARFEIEKQKIEFQKERLAFQQKQTEYHSDSVSEASDLDVDDYEGWTDSIVQNIDFSEETDTLEDDAEEEAILQKISNNSTEIFDDNCSEFSDFSLELEDDM